MLASGCAKKPFLRGQYLVDLGSSVEKRGSKKEKCVKTLRERERERENMRDPYAVQYDPRSPH